MKYISLQRILGIMRQEYYMTLHAIETINDVFVYSVIQLFLFGFIFSYFIGSKNSLIGQYLLLGMIMWEIIRIVQYSISVGCLWNIWARNLSNMFISPLVPAEYLIGFSLSGIAKALFAFLMDSSIAYAFFHFNIYHIGILNIFLYFLNLSFFGFSAGIVIMGLIFRYGTKIQAFAWSIIPFLQPLTAAFYPVSILPKPLQIFAELFPTTYVFEAARHNLTDSAIQWSYVITAFCLNIIYLVLAIWVFNILFKGSKNSGQFARNES